MNPALPTTEQSYINKIPAVTPEDIPSIAYCSTRNDDISESCEYGDCSRCRACDSVKHGPGNFVKITPFEIDYYCEKDRYFAEIFNQLNPIEKASSIRSVQ